MTLNDLLRREVKPSFKHGLYRHFKGGLYRTTCVCNHTETGEEMIVYHSEDGRMWVRPLAMFLEMVPSPDGEGTVQRFSWIPENETENVF
jgi:hypothetical protein